MSLAGEAVVAIWNGIRPEARQEFYEWHCREHMPERVAVPGFRRGRRLIAERGRPEWFTLYEVDHPETLDGPDYLARLNAPTEWTRRVVPSFTDVTRSLCRVMFSTGTGVGGYMATLRCDPAPERSDQIERHLLDFVAGAGDRPGIYGSHLCRLEREASLIPTEEKKSRSDPTLVAEYVLMIEAALSDPLNDVLAQDLARERIIAAGASPDAPLEVGLYRLEFLC
jgi:hypothetical protein